MTGRLLPQNFLASDAKICQVAVSQVCHLHFGIQVSPAQHSRGWTLSCPLPLGNGSFPAPTAQLTWLCRQEEGFHALTLCPHWQHSMCSVTVH